MSASKIAIHERQWEEMAHLDPLFAILTEKAKQFGKWDTDEFFASGRKEIDELMEARGFPKGDNGRALDFGCGVGRLSKALRSYFGHVTGVDISEGMIELASQYAPACRFILNREEDLSLFEDNTFDFIYSNIVLQHQPTQALARRYIGEFIRIIKPRGIIVFQMPYKLTLRYALQPKRRLYALLRACGASAQFLYNRLHLNPIRTICLETRDVQNTVARLGGTILRVYPDGFNHHSMSYVVTKNRAR